MKTTIIIINLIFAMSSVNKFFFFSLDMFGCLPQHAQREILLKAAGEQYIHFILTLVYETFFDPSA